MSGNRVSICAAAVVAKAGFNDETGGVAGVAEQGIQIGKCGAGGGFDAAETPIFGFAGRQRGFEFLQNAFKAVRNGCDLLDDRPF